MKHPLRFLFVLFLIAPLLSNAQSHLIATENYVTPRMRVIIDNDLSGDPDGQFQLVHQLLSPSTQVCGVIGSHLNGRGFDGSTKTATSAAAKAREIIGMMGLTGKVPVFEGSNEGMDTMTVAKDSEGARFIIKEAMRTDTKLPLYILCGAGLTNIASAWLMQPEIAKHITLVWIGGQEYDNILPPPGYTIPEYNLNICIPAAQTIFNLSDIPLWQIPRNAYRQCCFSMAEMENDVKPMGKIGAYLSKTIEEMISKLGSYGMGMGELYVLGDSPLTLLTALQTGFEADPASSGSVIHAAPLIWKDGSYRYNPKGRTIRIFNQIDTRLMFNDMTAKLKLFAPNNK